MKKIISVVLLLVVMLLPASALADVRHFVPGLDTYIELPESFAVMTTEMEEDNPLISLYGENMEEAKAYMAQNDVYFIGTDYEKYVIAIVMDEDDETEGLRRLNKAELKMVEMGLESEFGKDSTTLVEHPQLKFFRYERAEDEMVNIGYITFENGRQLVINISSLDEEYNEELSAFSDSVLNGMYFGSSAFGEGWQDRTDVSANAEAILGIASIIGLIFICIVPIFIYRFAIRKKPVSYTRAKWIAAIIAIALLVLLMLLGEYSASNRSLKWVAVLCQFVNYRILVHGATKNAQQEAPVGEAKEVQMQGMAEINEISDESGKDKNALEMFMVCPSCGAELLNGTKTCHNCGKELN